MWTATHFKGTCELSVALYVRGAHLESGEKSWLDQFTRTTRQFQESDSAPYSLNAGKCQRLLHYANHELQKWGKVMASPHLSPILTCLRPVPGLHPRNHNRDPEPSTSLRMAHRSLGQHRWIKSVRSHIFFILYRAKSCFQQIMLNSMP